MDNRFTRDPSTTSTDPKIVSILNESLRLCDSILERLLRQQGLDAGHYQVCYVDVLASFHCFNISMVHQDRVIVFTPSSMIDLYQVVENSELVDKEEIFYLLLQYIIFHEMGHEFCGHYDWMHTPEREIPREQRILLEWEADEFAFQQMKWINSEKTGDVLLALKICFDFFEDRNKKNSVTEANDEHPRNDYRYQHGVKIITSSEDEYPSGIKKIESELNILKPSLEKFRMNACGVRNLELEALTRDYLGLDEDEFEEYYNELSTSDQLLCKSLITDLPTQPQNKNKIYDLLGLVPDEELSTVLNTWIPVSSLSSGVADVLDLDDGGEVGADDDKELGDLR